VNARWQGAFAGLTVQRLAVGGASTIAFALIVVLGMEVRALRPLAIELSNKMAGPYAGQWVPTFRASTANGDSATVGETTAGRSQVLFVFATQCPYCAQTLPAWDAIARNLLADSAGRFDVFGVTLSSPDSTREYVERNRLSYRVVHFPTKKLRNVYRLKSTPLTLVLTPAGQVAYARAGAFESQAVSDSVIAAAHREAEREPTRLRKSGG
jgi:peroxiredoxin